MFASFKYTNDEHIPDANYALVCVLLIYEALVKVDNVIVRATPAQNTYKSCTQRMHFSYWNNLII